MLYAVLDGPEDKSKREIKTVVCFNYLRLVIVMLICVDWNIVAETAIGLM